MDFATSSGWCCSSCRRRAVSDRMWSIGRLIHDRADKRVRIRDCDANTHSNCAGFIRLHHRKCD
jgi:hypothetical protein